MYKLLTTRDRGRKWPAIVTIGRLYVLVKINDAYMRIYSPWHIRNAELPSISSPSVPSILDIMYIVLREGEVRRVQVPGCVV